MLRVTKPGFVPKPKTPASLQGSTLQERMQHLQLQLEVAASGEAACPAQACVETGHSSVSPCLAPHWVPAVRASVHKAAQLMARTCSCGIGAVRTRLAHKEADCTAAMEAQHEQLLSGIAAAARQWARDSQGHARMEQGSGAAVCVWAAAAYSRAVRRL